MNLPQSAAGGRQTPLQTFGSIFRTCCITLLALAAIFTSVPGRMLLYFFNSVFEEAKAGNPWPALITVNLIGFLVPLVIRWCHKKRLTATP